MITKTITDDSTLGIKKAVVKFEPPAIEISCYRSTETDLNTEIRARLLDIVDQLLAKNLT